MNKPDSAIPIKCNNLTEFFVNWFKFIEPLHHLTNREIDVIAALCEQRYLLSKVISDEQILNRVLFSEDTKKKILKNLGMTIPYYQVIMSKLKKNKLVCDGKLAPQIVPKLREDNVVYTLLLVFDIKNE